MTDPKDELAERLDDRKPGKMSDDSRTDTPDQGSQIDDDDQTSERGSSIKEETTHVAFYVPDDLAEEYHDLYERFDAMSKLADQGEVRKNRDFNRQVLEFVLENRDDLREYMGIDDLG